MRQEILIDETCFFCSIPMLIAMGLGAAAAMFYSFNEIAILLWALTGVCGAAYGYGKKALKGLDVKTEASRSVMFPGEFMTISYIIRNTGKLPAVNAMVRVPIYKRDIIVPCEDACYRPLLDSEQSKARMYGEALEGILEKQIPVLNPGEQIEWEVKLKAEKRGERKFGSILIYCGEPFGLRQSARSVSLNDRILVCAAPVAVKISPFLQNLQMSNHGVKSIYEDPTMVKGNRKYEASDPIKYINWKLLAKQKELMIDLYDYAFTKNVHFIFDGESFNARHVEEKAFENSLQILFSVILRLEQKGMGCGLSLPQTQTFSAVNIFYEGKKTVSRIAEYLARYQLKVLEEKKPEKTFILQEHSSFATAVLKAREQKEQKQEIQKSKSVFRTADLLKAQNKIGEFFYITYDAAKIEPNQMLRVLEGQKLTLLSYRKYRRISKQKESRAHVVNLSAIGEERSQ